jgi:hypothetical protein
MGWTESPALFCSATETARDVIQHFIDNDTVLKPHTLEHHFVPDVPAPRQTSPSDDAWQMSAVFVDDYLLGAVESSDGSGLAKTARAALHGIHSFRRATQEAKILFP